MTSAEIIDEIGVRLARVAPRDSGVVLTPDDALGWAGQRVEDARGGKDVG